MEARTDGQQSRRLAAPLLLILAAVLLLRLPFLTQAVQGDDPYFLASAEHAQIDPLHPNHTTYVFEGRDVDFRGFPHPPLNAWFLALLLAALGDVREVPFHAAYILFSLLAAFAMYALARRFSPHPAWATLLFLAVPAFAVNGNSFESDVPLLAFWTAGMACFVWDRLALAALFLFLASMTAFQAVLAMPILALYLLTQRRRGIAWLVVFTPIFGICAWQLFEFATSGQFPFAIAAGYHRSYDFDRFALKLRNAEALAVHACWIVCPLLPPLALWISRKRRDRDTLFLAGWIGLFFGGALAFFYAGSARYLLPMAPAVVLLVSRLRPAWLAAGFALQMAISIPLAIVNYRHWDGYRQFASSLKENTARHRTWINAEWGLRYYLEAQGGLPIHKDQRIPAGDLVVTSELAYPVSYNRGGEALVPVANREIRPGPPVRIIGLHARSGFSTADKGLLPFDIGTSAIDEIHAAILEARPPTLSDLPMSAPEAEQQILSGISKLEDGRWRWMGSRGEILLKPPPVPMPIRIEFSIHERAPGRTITVWLDGREIESRTFPGPGNYVLTTSPQKGSAIAIEVDKTFTSPGDSRELGLILTEAGFRK